MASETPKLQGGFWGKENKIIIIKKSILESNHLYLKEKSIQAVHTYTYIYKTVTTQGNGFRPLNLIKCKNTSPPPDKSQCSRWHG